MSVPISYTERMKERKKKKYVGVCFSFNKERCKSHVIITNEAVLQIFSLYCRNNVEYQSTSGGKHVIHPNELYIQYITKDQKDKK